jgi:hypothetical protein
MEPGQAPTLNSNAEAEFRALVGSWQRDTDAMSSTASKITHPTYRRIVEMGWRAVRLLLPELERNPEHWFWALTEITGEDPVEHEHTGNLAAMAEDLQTFARKKNYL